MLAYRANAVDEMRGTAVAQVVAVHARDHDIAKFQCGDGLRQIDRLFGIERQRFSFDQFGTRQKLFDGFRVERPEYQDACARKQRRKVAKCVSGFACT